MLLAVDSTAVQLYNTSPAVFVENAGQWADESVRFVHQGNNATIALTDQGPVFQLFRPVENMQSRPAREHGQLQDIPAMEGTNFSVHFNGANTVRPVGIGKSNSAFNYFIGDESTWRSNVSGFERIEYPNLYAGIDLQTWGKRTHLKYEFHVAPGADYSQIGMSYEGIKGLSIDGRGRLHIRTELDEIIDDAPLVYQQIDGKRCEVPSKFVLVGNNAYRFEISGMFDRSRELIIDPNLAWGSYLGGSGDERSSAIAVDGSGDAWVAGWTTSADFPGGGFDNSYGGGFYDAFVAKVHANGTLAWGSYLGGSGYDYATGVATDVSGNAWVAGYTQSTNFPGGGFDNTWNAGVEDAFVAKVNSNGTLAWGSYLGGSGTDSGRGIALDGSGNAWVTGVTSSANFPGGGFDNSYHVSGLGTDDAFVAKINADGTLAWGSYLGGVGDDRGKGIAVDPSGNAWITGEISFADFPGGGFDNTYNGGTDAFVAKVNANGSLAWGSFLGGTGYEHGNGIAADGFGNAWIVGWTSSTDFPGGGFDNTYSGGTDAFVAKVNANGSLAWGSYLGGTDYEQGNGIAIDGSGNAWVTGDTESTDLPGGGFDPTSNGSSDAFVAKLNIGGNLAWGSYMGGSGNDYASGIAVDTWGDAWVTGQTYSTDFPGGGSDSNLGGSVDGFVSRVMSLPSIPPAPNLAPAFDGGLVGDGVTNFKRPRIVGTGQPLVTVRLYDGGVLLGQANADISGAYAFLPTVDLADGQHLITAVSVASDGNVSDPSLPLNLTIDTKIAVAWSFVFDAAQQKLNYDFGEAIVDPFALTDLALQNLTSESQIESASMSLSRNTDSGENIFSFPGLPSGVLPDGNYLAVLGVGNVSDIAGNHVTTPRFNQFFFLNGDANRDRRVTTLDFNILTANFGGSTKIFSQGDFNYDGSVTSVDFGILLAQYGKSVPAPGPLPSGAVVATNASSTLFASRALDDGEDSLLLI